MLCRQVLRHRREASPGFDFKQPVDQRIKHPPQPVRSQTHIERVRQFGRVIAEVFVVHRRCPLLKATLRFYQDGSSNVV
ncbi:hypothetical protein ALQ36_103180 [Pseudomonas syringae pv. primulae]|uniref:Uncharacterized protein n=1 Tax=Pseudomonas syringae pv. primulae TaxID=251707 RepID=A0A3M5TNT8_9PSED|nr:hypothetical protein ALQ36_103180 [Pseudomonas syringae pv. primulae]RMU35222.1 hypothetical protein ALP30_103628 [Pseudomonas syringae pv. primulae]